MNIITITATLEDGSTVVLFPVAGPTPIPASDPIIEVDVKTESGAQEKFVPDTATETSA